MLGTQFHPEFLSRPNAPHPLFLAFIKAASRPNHESVVALNSHSGEEKD
jgi:CTP synthase